MMLDYRDYPMLFYHEARRKKNHFFEQFEIKAVTCCSVSVNNLLRDSSENVVNFEFCTCSIILKWII